MSFLKLVAAAATTIAVYGVLKTIVFFTKPWRSYLRFLPGPKNASLLWGNMKEIQMADNQVLHDQWVKEYGTTFKYKGFFMVSKTRCRGSKLLLSDDHLDGQAMHHGLACFEPHPNTFHGLPEA